MQRGNLDDLVAFLAVARESSFTNAAAKLGVSQSALSHTMRALEARLGVRLLTRTTRSVAPTEAGERLLADPAARASRRSRPSLRPLSELREKPAGTIRITATDMRPTRSCGRSWRSFLPRLSGHQGRDHHRLRLDRYRRRSVSTPACGRRAGRQGHDRGAHRAGHAHGGGGCAVLFQRSGRSRRRRRT